MTRFRDPVPLVSLVFLVLLVLLPGCGDDSNPVAPDLDAIREAGWTAYVSGDLDEAEARFEEVLGFAPGDPGSLTGLGWVALDRREIIEALDHFSAARMGAVAVPDAQSGVILAEAARDHAAEVIAEGESLLLAIPDYVFPYKDDYGADDIRWMIARAALDLGDYDRVVAQLDLLSPGHGLDPAQADFIEASLALLESLRGSV